MTLTRAIEIIDKWEQCGEKDNLDYCRFRDPDICNGCPLHVTPKQYCTAVDTLHKFAKSIKRRCETK